MGHNGGNDAVRVFTRPVFEFIGDALADGKNVMVHCLAGAHRAGTTGCACRESLCPLSCFEAVYGCV